MLLCCLLLRKMCEGVATETLFRAGRIINARHLHLPNTFTSIHACTGDYIQISECPNIRHKHYNHTPGNKNTYTAEYSYSSTMMCHYYMARDKKNTVRN